LIELAAGIAYNADSLERDGLALYVTRAAFTRTSAYAGAEATFCEAIYSTQADREGRGGSEKARLFH
jgi:hypothetical protein